MSGDAAAGHPGRERRVRLALALNLLIVAVEVVGGLSSHSTALVADAGHNLGDVASLLFAVVALRLATRAPTGRRSFGYHRATILSALGNVALLFVLASVVIEAALSRIAHPGAPVGATVAAVGSVALLCNLLAALLVAERSGDLQMRSLLVHLGGDALSSLAVVGIGLLVATTGRFAIADPIASLLISVLILLQGVKVARESAVVLLEGTPDDIDPEALAGELAALPGIESVHDLHCWSLSSDLRALSAHLVLEGHPTLEEAQAVSERAKAAVGGPFRLAHATFELECEPCGDEDSLICSFGLLEH